MLYEYFKSLNLCLENYSQTPEVSSFCIKIKARAGSKLVKMKINADGNLDIYIREKAVDGQANKAIVEFISKVFCTSKQCVEIIKGDKSKIKTIQISYFFSKVKTQESILNKIKSKDILCV